jgi:hypothetical protein
VVVVDPNDRDCVLGLLGGILLGDRWHHLWWYRAAQGVKQHDLLLLIDVVVVDDAPESPRLQLHLHRECSIRVIGLGESRVSSPTTYLMNHPLDHDSVFVGVIGHLSHHLHNKD